MSEGLIYLGVVGMEKTKPNADVDGK